jgi:ribose 1,5-bisphosphokinase PhnN
VAAQANNPFNQFAKVADKKMWNSLPTGSPPPLSLPRPVMLGEFEHFTYSHTDEYGFGVTARTHVILLVGPTGSGKSRIINCLFNDYVAESKMGINSVQIKRGIQFYYGSFTGQGVQNKPVCVVDSMGFCDTKWKTADLVDLLQSRINSSVDHFNRILFVANNRILPEATQTALSLLNNIGAKCNPNIHVVLTHCEGQEDLVRSNLCESTRKRADIREFILQSDQKLQGGGTVPRIFCTSFADNKIVNESPSHQKEYARDFATLLQVAMYPSENQKPGPLSGCTIL